MQKILRSTETADMQIVCKGKRFPCHKNILCAQCPVFERFLLGNSKEKQDSIIRLDDSEPGAVEFMLRFLYTGEALSVPSQLELPVLQLADKYQLDRLKRACGERYQTSTL